MVEENNNTSVEEIVELDNDTQETVTEDLSTNAQQIDNISVNNTGVNNTSVDNTSVDQQSIKNTEEVKTPTNEELNFKALRSAKKDAERERDELLKRIQSLEAQKNDSLYNNDVDDIDDDSEMSKANKKIKALEGQFTAYQNQAKTVDIEQKLKKEFPDLETVVNADNIEVLKARDPNFASIIAKQPTDPNELYHRAVAAYALIKKYGIYVKDDHSKDRERVANNLAKPRHSGTATQSSGSKGLAEFSQFSNLNEEERRAAIFKMGRERANS